MNLVERIATVLLFGMILWGLGSLETRMNKLENIHVIKICPNREVLNVNTLP